MVTIKINQTEYDIPTDWKEITLRQYIELATYIDDVSHIRLLSIFTGIDFDILANFPCDEFKIEVMPEMNFLQEEIDVLLLQRKKQVKIGEHLFDVILDPSNERLGQKLFMQQIVDTAITNNLPHHTLVAPVIANYYAPYIHPQKKWEEKHIKEFEQLVLNMPMVDAYPEANFFLRGYIRYSTKKVEH